MLLTSSIAVLAAPAPRGAQAADTQETVEAPQPTVRVVSGAVEIANPTDTAVETVVFAITGAVVKQSTVAPGDTQHIDLAGGYYIVRIGRTSHRIAI